MNKKFELIKNDSIEIDGHKLYRIRALIDFNDIKAGDLGGYVEHENNLSQMDNCWIYDNACVFGNARVYDNASVYDNAYVADNAHISGNARVCNNAGVYGEAKVFDNARIFGSARISGDAIIEKDSDYIVFKNSWSSKRYFTYTKSNKMWRVGCFYGNGDELIQKAYKDSEESGKHYELYVNLIKEMEELKL